jgi:peptidoglycan/LPS O-acetylase OafA/YrhL
VVFQARSEQRLPQLDSLRAFAIGGVMIVHSPFNFIERYIPLDLGVQLFFVLSGFLITGILLRGGPTVAFIGGFYIRRALRLFPLYYLVLAIVATFSAEIRNAWPYYSFYGVNFWVAANMKWGALTHFWTLAVEEQFYVLWPFVVLFCSRRVLTCICVLLIVAAPIFRFVMAFDPFAFVLLPGSFDCLACGALLAVLGPQRPTLSRMIVACLSLGLMIVSWLILGPTPHALYFSLPLPFFFYLTSGAACEFGGLIGTVLSSPLLRYIGRISYGLYVIHYPIALWLGPYLTQWTRHVSLAGMIAFAITIALAALSWHYFEGPINRSRESIVNALLGRSLQYTGSNALRADGSTSKR